MSLLGGRLQRRPIDIFIFSFDYKGLWTVFMHCPTYKQKELAVFI